MTLTDDPPPPPNLHLSPLTPPVEQIPDQTNVGTISDFMFKAGVQVCVTVV